MENKKDKETAEEKAKRLGVPLIWPKKKLPTVDANPVVSICGKCNREVRRMEHYACMISDCPMKLIGG